MRKIKTAAIIGGGLAGTACAYMLAQEGVACTIYEAGERLAAGASGNARGLYNPRFTAQRSAESAYFSAAFDLALAVFAELGDAVDWQPCGALHLITDETKRKRFYQTCESWGWGAGRMRIVSPPEASDIAGAEITHEAMYLPESGAVSPEALCLAYAEKSGAQVVYEAQPTIETVKADIVVLAAGMGCLDFEAAGYLPLRGVRGQVTLAQAGAGSQGLRTALCYGGYTTPAWGGVHMIGSSFQRWLDHSNIMEQDNEDNVAKLAAIAPKVAQGLSVCGARAGVRTTAPDHLPIVGRAAERLYISTAHGSHGILSSLMAARILAAEIAGVAAVFDDSVRRMASPQRFG